MIDAEHVILLDEDARQIGTAPKSSVHTTDTALHLAFSCHVRNDRGEVLVTRRALGKTTWPGVWTNSFCGHPLPGEPIETAVHRRAEYELGLIVTELEPAIPDFRYRAVDASGIVENEICPVFVARIAGEPDPNPLEVMDSAWVAPDDLARAVEATPWAFSPWLVLQVPQLAVFERSAARPRAS